MLFKSRFTTLLAAASAAVGIGMGLSGPAVHANTILVQDSFSGSSIANPPWTTTTANNGTISENGALDVGLAPANSEEAYVYASDGVSSLHSAATTVTYDLQADVNFSSLVLTTNPSNKSQETLDVLQLFPVNYLGNFAEASALLVYNGSSGAYLFKVVGNIDNTSGAPAVVTANITPANFASHAVQHWDLSTTLTNNGSNSWTDVYGITVTSGTQTWTLTDTYTHAAYTSAFNPITNSNRVQVGDVLHTASTTYSPFLSGSYSISNFSDTLVSVPEPATLSLMGLAGLGIVLLGRKRKTA